MKAWQKQDFGLGNLKLVNLAIPKPGPKQVLVRVSAVSLNYRDKAIIDGAYLPHLMKEPFVPVSDAAGVVVAVGKDVIRFKEGDRVTSHLFTHWIEDSPGLGLGESSYALGGPLDGGLAEYMLLDEEATVLTPPSLTDEEAATLPIAALTVWFALVEYGKLKSGETVLVQGTGGVSIFGVQIASALGARVIATSSSDEKLDRVRALGASDGINYAKDPEWQKVALDLTSGKGVDHILEVIGGESINRSIEAITPRGHISVIGFLQNMDANVNVFPLLFKQPIVQGIWVGHRKAFDRMNLAFEKYKIKPVIDTVYPFNDAIAAYKHLERGAFGKIVIRIAE